MFHIMLSAKLQVRMRVGIINFPFSHYPTGQAQHCSSFVCVSICMYICMCLCSLHMLLTDDLKSDTKMLSKCECETGCPYVFVFLYVCTRRYASTHYGDKFHRYRPHTFTVRRNCLHHSHSII